MSTGHPVGVANKHLAEEKLDVYYHLGFSTNDDLPKLFGDVRFVFFGGTNSRMEKIAKEFATEFFPLKAGEELKPIGSTDRFHMFKVGPIISVSHQMGMPSFSILLHEVTKLLNRAGAKDVVYFRIGTSGGVGSPGGTVVLTTVPVNGYLEPYYELVSLGKLEKRPAELDEQLRAELVALKGDINVVEGRTMSVDCFYEGQGRLDGAICEYEKDDKMAFLKKAHESGVRNIEMESVMFGAFCKKVGVRAAVVCCTLLDRFNGDKVTMTPEQYAEWTGKVFLLCKRYVAKTLNIPFNK